MTTTVPYAELRDDLSAVLSKVRYTTMTTVDPKGRPRTRVLIAVWELDRDAPLGWLATFRTPVKDRHLANNPHATFSYWDHSQETAAIDAVATWTDDPEQRRHVWDLYGKGSPRSVGYPPAPYWPGGPDSRAFQVLKLEPYRVQVLRRTDLMTGGPDASRLWTPDSERRQRMSPGV